MINVPAEGPLSRNEISHGAARSPEYFHLPRDG
jgi:hypothetical protein